MTTETRYDYSLPTELWQNVINLAVSNESLFEIDSHCNLLDYGEFVLPTPLRSIGDATPVKNLKLQLMHVSKLWHAILRYSLFDIISTRSFGAMERCLAAVIAASHQGRDVRPLIRRLCINLDREAEGRLNGTSSPEAMVNFPVYLMQLVSGCINLEIFEEYIGWMAVVNPDYHFAQLVLFHCPKLRLFNWNPSSSFNAAVPFGRNFFSGAHFPYLQCLTFNVFGMPPQAFNPELVIELPCLDTLAIPLRPEWCPVLQWMERWSLPSLQLLQCYGLDEESAPVEESITPFFQTHGPKLRRLHLILTETPPPIIFNSCAPKVEELVLRDNHVDSLVGYTFLALKRIGFQSGRDLDFDSQMGWFSFGYDGYVLADRDTLPVLETIRFICLTLHEMRAVVGFSEDPDQVWERLVACQRVGVRVEDINMVDIFRW